MTRCRPTGKDDELFHSHGISSTNTQLERNQILWIADDYLEIEDWLILVKEENSFLQKTLRVENFLFRERLQTKAPNDERDRVLERNSTPPPSHDIERTKQRKRKNIRQKQTLKYIEN